VFHVLLRVSLVLLVVGVVWIIASRSVRSYATRVVNENSPRIGASEAFELIGLSLKTLLQDPRLLLVFVLLFAGPRGCAALVYRYDLATRLDREHLSALLQPRAFEAATQFAELWIGVALTFGVLGILGGQSFRLGSALHEVRAKWKSILIFAAIYCGGSLCFGILGGLYGDFISARHHTGVTALPAAVWAFSLALGLPVLAAESHRGLFNVGRAWTLIRKVWWARLVGVALIILIPRTAFAALELALKPILGQPSGMIAFVWIPMLPVLLQVFDTCLYLRVVEQPISNPKLLAS